MNFKNRVAAIYFVGQSIACCLWWVLLMLQILPRQFFFSDSVSKETVISFLFPDLILIIGSIVCALGLIRKCDWTAIAIWGLATACWYPTLFCLSQSIQTDQAWLGTAMMVSLAGLNLAIASSFEAKTLTVQFFRTYKTDRHSAVAWTFFQIIIFWSVFLLIIPKSIDEQTVYWQLDVLKFNPHPYLGGIILSLGAVLGFWSSWQFSYKYGATPLPTATPKSLVTSGPYRWVRNPMAIAGISKGISSGIILGNWGVVVYSCLGGILWHFIVRIYEEEDLQERFGNAYLSYQRGTPLWIPRLIPTSPKIMQN